MSGSTRKPVRGLCISCEGYLSGPPINVSTVRRPANLPTTLRTVSNPSYLVTVVPAVNRSRHPAVNSHNEKYHGHAWPPFLAFYPSNFFPTHAMALIHIPFFSQERTFAGIGAVTVDGPLDLLDVNFQVSSRGPEGSTIGRGMWRALCEICAQGARDGVGYIAV